MSEEIYWIYVVSIKDGAFEEFKALANELTDATRREPDAVAYEFSTPDDGRTVHIFERYRNSAAIVGHVDGTFARHAERFAALATTERVTIYGDPDERAREIVDQWGAVYAKPFAGFHKS